MENKLCIEFKNITLGYKKPGETISILKNITINQLEKALFAFSSNYFSNENLIMKNENIDKTDYDEAKRLEIIFNSNN
jgi:hypothetical protein